MRYTIFIFCIYSTCLYISNKRLIPIRPNQKLSTTKNFRKKDELKNEDSKQIELIEDGKESYIYKFLSCNPNPIHSLFDVLIMFNMNENFSSPKRWRQHYKGNQWKHGWEWEWRNKWMLTRFPLLIPRYWALVNCELRLSKHSSRLRSVLLSFYTLILYTAISLQSQ